MASEAGSQCDPFDEARDRSGAPRAGYAGLLAALERADLEALRAAVAGSLADDGVSFGGAPFVVDPVPRLLTVAEWGELEAGLGQRARALNAFLLDAYHERRIAAAGMLSPATIEAAEGYEPDLAGRLPRGHPWPAAIIGFDVVRAPDGAFLVLEDNLRTPSGYAYALAARTAVQRNLAPIRPAPREVHAPTAQLLAETVRAADPRGTDDPVLVLLTDGPANVAYYEHAEAARWIGALLRTPDELRRAGDELRVHDGAGRDRRVDVVLRRTDEDRVRDETGAVTPVAELLLPAWLAGGIGLVNAFGNGVADDKLVHAHVEEFIRFYLGEEPLLRSVPSTHVATDPEGVISRLGELVIKRRHSHGGLGVVIGPHAEQADLDRLADEIRADPEAFVTQPLVALSSHPTVVGDRLEPRHVDLRVFSFSGGVTTALMPGGLSRVALQAGALVVNSSQDGGGKDTWIIAHGTDRADPR